jgi:hypothetical protein
LINVIKEDSQTFFFNILDWTNQEKDYGQQRGNNRIKLFYYFLNI